MDEPVDCGAVPARALKMHARRILVVLVVALGWFAQMAGGWPQSVKNDASTVNQADALFLQEKWSEARTAYDALVKGLDRQSPRYREVLRRAIQSSLKLSDWPGALKRAKNLIVPPPHDRYERFDWRWNAEEKEDWITELGRLDFAHEALTEIAAAVPASQSKIVEQLAVVRIDLDHQLARHLDPPREREMWGWDSALEDVSWWWHGVPEAQEYIQSNPRYSRWRHEIGIALAHDGKPMFLDPPPQYSADLPRSRKLLFVLAEIERLDTSVKRDDAAAALFARARLMRRLYGPQTDGNWRGAEFYYRFDKRPSFVSRAVAAVKETWQLADDEARTEIAERSRVIQLPASQSPLGLLARLEREYPLSTSVPQAIHERALYYQSRRQFAKALDEYGREIRLFPKHELTRRAQEQIARIEHADVILGRTGIYASGVSPQLWFACRNAEEVDFKARHFDFAGWMKESHADGLRSVWHGWGFNRFFENDGDDKEVRRFKQFAGGEAAQWTQPVARSDRVASHSTAAPLTEAGVYLVGARVPGSDQSSHGLVVVSGIAIVQKSLANRILLWAVDPMSGKPLPGQKIEVQERDWSDRDKGSDTTLVCDQNGIAEYRPDENRHSDTFLMASAEGRGVTFCEMAGTAYDWRESGHTHFLCLTDRPAYRPGSTVSFRIWVRDLFDRRYEPAQAGTKLTVAIRDPHYHTIRTQDMETDELGSVSAEFKLGTEAALGEYELLVAGESHHGGSRSFRVEEYKKPEFEVSVVPGKGVTLPGESVSARIEARYYFGLPVAGGTVQYQIVREELKPTNSLPAEFDWLYGAGYGAYSSARRSDEDDDDDEDNPYGRWWRFGSRGEMTFRESVAEGNTQLDVQGTAEIRFDPDVIATGRDRNWRYTIDVQVRDEGRRTVSGSGSILAPRQEFQVFAQLDRGWYAPGDRVLVDFQARSANDLPVSASGQATLLLLEQEAGAVREMRPIQVWKVNTGADGRSTLEFPAPPPGRYRLHLRTRDSADREVAAEVGFWVFDELADLRRSPWPALQIISDRRTYRVGETARLLVLTANDDAVVLLQSGPDEHQFLPIPRHARILEVPITEREVPNSFVGGTVVREGTVHTQICQLFAPPVADLLKLEVTAEKAVHRPGENGKLKIRATDSTGKPVSGDLALTAFDKAVTAIEPESKLGPRELVRARMLKRWQWCAPVATSLEPRRFGSTGTFMCPEFYLTDDYVPQIGAMGGAAPTGGDPGVGGDSDGLTPSGLQPGMDLVAATVRSEFADTALWLPHLKLDGSGEAATEIRFPQSLTTWRLRGYLVTNDTRVGDLATEFVTTKNLLLRLQSPRFLVEQDEVVLSANVHNRLSGDKTVTAELIVPSAIFRATDAVGDTEGNLRLTAQARVPSGGSHRFDWTLNVIGDGLATITVRALTDEESDALRTAIPVRTHGTLVTATQTGSFRAGERGEKTLSLAIPEDADLRKTRIVVSLAPTPASAAFEAIPYLVGYPYGCVEQTMSRFYPTVLAAKTLKQLGIDISRLAARTRPEHATAVAGESPSREIDAAELVRMTEAGLQRLQKFQHEDGGWGWWEHDSSSPYMTAYVLLGLNVAAEAGAKVDEEGFQKGSRYLANYDARQQRDAAAPHAASVQHTEMLVAYALALSQSSAFRSEQPEPRKAIQDALTKRLDAALELGAKLPVYDRLLLALALPGIYKDRASAVLGEIMKLVVYDNERETAHLPVTSRESWHAWNSEVETNAWLLRTLVVLDRDNPVIPKLVNWLALNRKQGRFWRSTQETALVVTAISEYLATAGVDTAEQRVELRLDGKPPVSVAIGRGEILGQETLLTLPDSEPLAAGDHRLTINRSASGMLNFAVHTEVLRTRALGTAQGHGMAIERKYSRLARPADAVPGAPAANSGASAASIRRPLTMDEEISIGDLIDIELTIKADEDYEYVAFEDVKLAGCEPIQFQSGHTYGDDLWANVELRDDRVVFFARYLRRGTHVLRYKVRCETPGRFHALPAHGFAMYAPEIRAQSDELRLRVRDENQ
jgi:uncharacterized protein YfaS (alpha-2-macroglobulin family)